MQSPPVADAARELEIPVIQPVDVNAPEAVEQIEAVSPEALNVCAFGAIVKEPLLSKWWIFNVHPSLLPRWRGAAPIERAIEAGDELSGVSIMRLVEALDAGPVCAQQTVAIAGRDYGALSEELSAIGGELLVDSLDRQARGEIEWIDQSTMEDERPVTYAEKIEREDRILLPMKASAAELVARIKALTPHIGAMFELANGDPLRVEAAEVSDAPVDPGIAIARDGELLIGASEGAVRLLRVKPAGGKAMDVESYLRGNPVPVLA